MLDSNVPTTARKPADEKNGRWNAQRGAGRLKAIVWTVILAATLYVGIKVVPVLLSEYEFQDSMQTMARYASVNRQTPKDIHDLLVKEAAKDEIPVKPEDIRITNESGNVRISADYSVTVDLQLYQWTLNFHPAASNNALI